MYCTASFQLYQSVLTALCAIHVAFPHKHRWSAYIFIFMYIYVYTSISTSISIWSHPPPSSSRAFLSTVRLQYYVSKCFLRCPKTIGICESFYTSYMLTSPCCALSWLHHPKPKPGFSTQTQMVCIYIYISVHICLYIYFYFYFYLVTPPPIIKPSLLVNCSSTILCLQVLSSMSKNHRYLRKFLHFIYADLSLLCSFLVTPPKTQTRIWFCVRANGKKHLSLSQ